MAAAEEISVVVAVVSFLSELDDIFVLKEEKRMALKAFFFKRAHKIYNELNSHDENSLI